MSPKTLNVLLIEDDKDCVALVKTAAEMAEAPFRFNYVSNGLEALDYLNQQGAYIGAARPDFVILDLNLPILNGWEVLSEMKGDPFLSKLPVVLLTTSQSHDRIKQEFGLNNECCYTKPDRFQDYIELMKDLEKFFWEGKLNRLCKPFSPRYD